MGWKGKQTRKWIERFLILEGKFTRVEDVSLIGWGNKRNPVHVWVAKNGDLEDRLYLGAHGRIRMGPDPEHTIDVRWRFNLRGVKTCLEIAARIREKRTRRKS